MRCLVPTLKLGIVPDTGHKTGRLKLKMRCVALGGPKVRKSRSNLTDPTDGRNVWLYMDCSASLFLNQRRLKAVLDVLDGMKKSGISKTGCLEFGAQWDKVLSIGLVWLVTSLLMTLFSGPEMELTGFSRIM